VTRHAPEPAGEAYPGDASPFERAGITVAALAVPAGMVYAEVAGLSPVKGLYALLLPALTYALIDPSGPTTVPEFWPKAEERQRD
jgi:hypothetical protein